MKTYAVVNNETGLVENTVLWDGVSEWVPPDGCSAIESEGVAIGWIYTNGEFSAPPEIVPSGEEIILANKIQKYNLIANASTAMKPLELASDIDEATTEEAAQLMIWKKYIVAVSRIDPEDLQPNWPKWPGV